MPVDPAARPERGRTASTRIWSRRTAAMTPRSRMPMPEAPGPSSPPPSSAGSRRLRSGPVATPNSGKSTNSKRRSVDS